MSNISMIGVPVEIAEQIVSYVYEESLKILYTQRRKEDDYGLPARRTFWAWTLVRLRLTTRSFHTAVDRVLFRDFKINRLSLSSLVRTETLLDSPSICASIRRYTISPEVCSIRPIVKRDAMAYYGEFADSYGSREPRLSYLRSVHAMRQEVAQHYDEQLRLMGLGGWVMAWIAIARLLRREHPSPQTTKLKTLPYFSLVSRLHGLRDLSIGYSTPQYRQDSRIHYLIKNDLSAGLASMLLEAPPNLQSLAITFPTLTDLRNIMTFLQDKTASISLRQITSLEIILAEETLGHRGRTVQQDCRVHGHSAGGKPIADLLRLLPDLVSLKLSYYEERHDATLVLQDFIVPTMEYLKKLHLRAFAMDQTFLIEMIERRTISMNIMGIAVFTGGPSWSEIVRTWHACRPFKPSSGLGYEYLIRGPLKYLDRSICTDETLSELIVHDRRILSGLSDEDSHAISETMPFFNNHRSYC